MGSILGRERGKNSKGKGREWCCLLVGLCPQPLCDQHVPKTYHNPLGGITAYCCAQAEPGWAQPSLIPPRGDLGSPHSVLGAGTCPCPQWPLQCWCFTPHTLWMHQITEREEEEGEKEEEQQLPVTGLVTLAPPKQDVPLSHPCGLPGLLGLPHTLFCAGPQLGWPGALQVSSPLWVAAFRLAAGSRAAGEAAPAASCSIPAAGKGREERD